ncbi:MAG: PorT family protein [Nonlabens sp.]|nr:PorT family protein [Nonlabens sp.]
MKTFLLSIAVLFAASTAIAQDNSYGIIAGYNVSKINNLGGDGFSENRPGFHVGVIAEFPMNEKWSWETSLAYSEEGEAFQIGNQDVDIKYTNINLPVQAKYYVTKGLSIHGGPQVGFITKIEQTIDDGEARTIKDRVNSHFAVTGGFGYDLDMGVFAKVSMAYGLTDTVDNIDFTNSERIATVHFSLGYKF